MGRLEHAVVSLIAAAALSSAGCVIGGANTGDAAGSWRKAPAAPLSPRERALGIWTGREALVIGGSDAPPCPSGASCGRQARPPLRDGAAFNPRTRSWRRIAAAPVGFDFAEGALVGRTAFVAAPGSDARPGAPSAVLASPIESTATAGGAFAHPPIPSATTRCWPPGVGSSSTTAAVAVATRPATSFGRAKGRGARCPRTRCPAHSPSRWPGPGASSCCSGQPPSGARPTGRRWRVPPR